MRRHLITILTFLITGAVVNLAVAWTCALTINPLDGERERARSQHLRVDRWSRPGAVVVFSERWRIKAPSGGEWGDPETLLDEWTGFHVMTPEWESRTTHHEQRDAQACGWPRLTLWCETYFRESAERLPDGGIATGLQFTWGRNATLKYSRALPFRPIWAGLIINSIFYAVILWLLIPGPFALRRFIRRRRGFCPKCGYPMGEAAVCTECGNTLPRPAVA
jgi:hypothetical protein